MCNRKISILTIQVLAVRDGKVKAFYLDANAPRIFNIESPRKTWMETVKVGDFQLAQLHVQVPMT